MVDVGTGSGLVPGVTRWFQSTSGKKNINVYFFFFKPGISSPRRSSVFTPQEDRDYQSEAESSWGQERLLPSSRGVPVVVLEYAP